MRVVDTSVPAKGFKAHNGQTFKILASYDGLCNVTKIYVNDKLRGIADPFDMGQYVFQVGYAHAMSYVLCIPLHSFVL